MEKRKLNKIAKVWCKSMISLSEPAVAFNNLSDKDIKYIEDCIIKIANRITSEKIEFDSDEIINKYK